MKLPITDVEESSSLVSVKLLDAADVCESVAREALKLDVVSDAFPSTVRLTFSPGVLPVGAVESGLNVLKDVGIENSSSDDLLASAVVCRVSVVCRVVVVEDV